MIVSYMNFVFLMYTYDYFMIIVFHVYIYDCVYKLVSSINLRNF